MQCVAVFTDGNNAKNDFINYYKFYCNTLKKYENYLYPVRNYSDTVYCKKVGKTGVLLTVENLGFLEGNTDAIKSLKSVGVGMASLVWKKENAFAYPSSCDGYSRCVKPLKPCGVAAVEALDENKMIIDVSHLSDGGIYEILKNRKTPLVASHSASDAFFEHHRNLTDEQVRKISDCGGVVGVALYDEFLGTKDVLTGAALVIRRLIDIGGEGLVALGSDFDGVPKESQTVDCGCVPRLFDCLSRVGISARVVDLIAKENALRVIKDVLG